jgi:hypothetical protein
MKVVTDLRIINAKNGSFLEMKQAEVEVFSSMFGFSGQIGSKESGWITVPIKNHISFNAEFVKKENNET